MTSVQDLKPFLAAEDYALMKQSTWSGLHDGLGGCGIGLFPVGRIPVPSANYYVQEWAGNFMMHLMVKDADACWQHIQDKRITEKYPGIMAKPPTMQPWGLRMLYLSDPSGVLWHIADKPEP